MLLDKLKKEDDLLKIANYIWYKEQTESLVCPSWERIFVWE